MSTATQTKQANAMGTIEALLQSLDDSPGYKSAEANTEAGGYDGPTEHPIKKEDDRTEDASVGSRARENEEDIREEHSPNEVDGKDVNKEAALGLGSSANQDDVQLNIGTKQRATGEDPASETAKAKAGKEDSDDGQGGTQNRGKTQHPARTSNDEIDGHKYSADLHSLLGSIKTAQESANECMAAITLEAGDAVKTKLAAMGKEAMCGKCGHNPCKCDGNAAEKAGSDMADAVMGLVDGHDKEALDAQVVNSLFNTIKVAYEAADMTHAFMNGVRAAEKEAADEEAEVNEDDNNGEQPADFPGGGEAGGDAPPEAGPMGGDEEEALLEALTSAEGSGMEAGGEAPVDAMGGMPPEGGGDPMMGGMPPEGGGDPMGGGEPPMGGGQIGPEELAMLAQALQEAGVTPEQLEAATMGKAARALKNASQKGTLNTKWEPQTQKEAQRYQKVLNYVKEVVNG